MTAAAAQIGGAKLLPPRPGRCWPAAADSGHTAPLLPLQRWRAAAAVCSERLTGSRTTRHRSGAAGRPPNVMFGACAATQPRPAGLQCRKQAHGLQQLLRVAPECGAGGCRCAGGRCAGGSAHRCGAALLRSGARSPPPVEERHSGDGSDDGGAERNVVVLLPAADLGAQLAIQLDLLVQLLLQRCNLCGGRYIAGLARSDDTHFQCACPRRMPLRKTWGCGGAGNTCLRLHALDRGSQLQHLFRLLLLLRLLRLLLPGIAALCNGAG